MRVIDLLNKIANNEEVPKQIKASRMIWTYEKGFNQYRNSNFQELIKYLDGHYSNYATGLTFNAILNYEVEIIEEDKELEESIKKLGKKLNGCFKLMVESKKYYYPKIHEDLLKKEDKEIEELEIEKLLQTKKWKRDKKAWNKINELIKAVNELKKGK